MNIGESSELDKVLDRLVAGEDVPPAVLMTVYAMALIQARKESKAALALARRNAIILYGMASVFSAVLFVVERGWLVLPI